MGIHTMGHMATRIASCTKTSATMNSIVSNTTQKNISSRKRTTNIFDCIKIWTMIGTTITRAIDRTTVTARRITVTARRITLTLNTIQGSDGGFPLMVSQFVSAAKAVSR